MNKTKIVSPSYNAMFKTVFGNNKYMLSLLVQSFMISPTVYKIFGLPYNNYLNYVDK